MKNTECEFKNQMQIFSAAPQMISAGANVTTNVQVANTSVETALLSQTLYANTMDATTMNFRVVLYGEISSSGSGDITLTLRYGTTDILELVTAALANEDDKPFKVEFTGRIHTTGATGKVVAHGFGTFFQGTPLYFCTDTANTGATVDLTADGSLNVTAEWDNESADDDIIVTHGWIEFYN
jgi:hypothetical protein